MEENKTIISPIPGVFYRKPSPDQDVFVNEGDSVKAGDVIGLVEVMKNYYEIKAEVDGVIDSFLVDEEQLLDAGQEIAILK
ncbi:acetyl-CoA carboxylase biotin carboxyl carrier protein subunit [Siminovitchia terrae]|uniref:Biotin carboxyl carrier protein of acetyl-CoA carboxylase n=1 Tax=Siminovitchia terrae TaxID=1914933 RepID=A0A429XE30_SIMTE|nr:acetyl-CoA carboxylase [Siminovitchia terrae]RST61571.1 biotin carboxyl carrier domain-containing protein [Siminovitchia terrae]GIN90559.1 acetyl-CoA carboxylase biotin carboxyl carrier protein subunit [Siminovitchia terrae]GIN97279.1 acetyl-CoA carboxylase biotin carboxyl carrier protein subunit [Siminovitchia terrae]